MKRYISAVRALAGAYIRRFFRDKTAMFFTFLFPLLFLLVFGTLNRSGNNISFDVVLINEAQSQFAEGFESQLRKNDIFTIDETVPNREDAIERMGRGELDTIVVLPSGFGDVNEAGQPSGAVEVYIEDSSPEAGQTVAAILEQVLSEINQDITGVTLPLRVETKSTATANLSAFDYVFAGLLGFTILSLGIFGLANSMPAEKKTGAFRRLRASPIGPSQLVLGNGIAYMVNGLISVALMFAAALVLFDFNMRGDYLNLFVFIVIGIVVMFGFGLAIGGWAKNENQSAPLTNVIALPLMFLSGVFFPRFLMPEWLQSITAYLPLTPIVDGLRFILTEGKTLLDLGPQLAILAIWSIVIYTIAFKVFRWE